MDTLQLFFAATGIRTRGDFAFFFESRAIARPEAQQGLAVRVRDLYNMQAPGSKTAAPRVVAGKAAQSSQPLPQRNAQFRSTLVDILVQGSRYAEQLGSPEAYR